MFVIIRRVQSHEKLRTWCTTYLALLQAERTLVLVQSRNLKCQPATISDFSEYTNNVCLFFFPSALKVNPSPFQSF